MPLSFAYDARDKRHLKAVNKIYNKNGLGSFPTLGIPAALYHVLFRGVKWISILNYFDYQKSEAIKELENRVGWREYGGKHYESIYTRFYQGYILKEKFGFDKKRVHLANLVLSKDISRESALEQIANEDYIGTQTFYTDMTFVLKKYGISQKEFDEIMHLQPQTHYDYPNNRILLEKSPKIFSIFKKYVTKMWKIICAG